MPDLILEENEGETLIERRRAAGPAARAAARNRAFAIQRAARAAAGLPPLNDQPRVVDADGVAAAAAAPPPAMPPSASASATAIASHVARLVIGNGVDIIGPLFRRLGVTNATDIKFLRERDLEGIPNLSLIQKRKIWGVLKFVTLGHSLEATTTLSDIHKVLTETKRTKESSSNNNSSSSSSQQQQQPNNIPSPLVQLTRPASLDPFDGSYQHWILWNNKAKFALAQSVLGSLILKGSLGEKMAKRYPGRDHLLFNMLAEAIVGGSARHLITKAQQQQQQQQPQAPSSSNKRGELNVAIAAAGSHNSVSSGSNSNHHHPNRNKSQASPKPTTAAAATTTTSSGRVLWQLLQREYTQGHMAFWILSDARQTLQKLRLTSADEKTDNDNDELPFQATSAMDYVQAFRNAVHTLEEYQQALPDSFLASTFVEHIQDEERFGTVKQQLLKDISSNNNQQVLSLESCITELLMADHMMTSQSTRKTTNSSSSSRSNRKRSVEDLERENHGETGEDDDRSKRLKAESVLSRQPK